MAPPITTLRIQGFKSLVDVQLQPRQLNIFIGKPNVGKSNILEALSLLGAGYSRGEKFMGEFIRYEDPAQLFTDGAQHGNVKVNSNIGETWLQKSYWNGKVAIVAGPNEYVNAAHERDLSSGTDDEGWAHHHLEAVERDVQTVDYEWPVPVLKGQLSENGNVTFESTLLWYHSIVRKYDFKKNQPHNERRLGYLKPPYGDNLFEVIRASKRLRQEASALFAVNQHQFVLRMANQTFETQKNIEGDVYSYPWSSVADTFQRLIFYLAAIESNTGAVLLFEEPEAHSFPAYIAQLAERIAEDVRAERNQYFITTHSPYLLDQLIENTSAEQVAVFIVGYADYQTTLTQIPDDQLGHLLDLSSDVFFNLNRLPLTDADAA